MKIPITINISNEQKERFLSMKQIHGKTFTDALDIGMDIIIAETKSLAEIQRRIDKNKLEHAKLLDELDLARSEQNITPVRKPRKKVKRGYFVKEHEEADYGCAVVAHSMREAKKMFWNHPDTNEDGCAEWINMRVEWKREAEVEQIPLGVIEDLRLGLISKIFEYIEEYECDQCHGEGCIQEFEGKALCEECYDRAVKEAKHENKDVQRWHTQ